MESVEKRTPLRRPAISCVESDGDREGISPPAFVRAGVEPQAVHRLSGIFHIVVNEAF